MCGRQCADAADDQCHAISDALDAEGWDPGIGAEPALVGLGRVRSAAQRNRGPRFIAHWHAYCILCDS